MGTFVAPAPAIRTSRVLVGLIAVAFVAALAVGVALATRAISLHSPTTNTSQDVLVRIHPDYGPDYPPHHGLAGPTGVVRGGSPLDRGLGSLNRVGSGSAQHGYGTDYPPHGGLAGPSAVGSRENAPARVSDKTDG
jgi:hypothetical protein